MALDVAFVSASNNRSILERNLLASPLLRDGGAPLRIVQDAPSAAAAYNRGLDETDAGHVVFVHHDVYLPAGWETVLAARVAEVARRDPGWALIGAFGVGLDVARYGMVWSSSLGGIVGLTPLEPAPAQSYDELLIVMRRDAGLRFDEGLPGFHLFGTDIVQQARAAGRGAYVAALPLIHNDRFHPALGDDFAEGYHYVRRKWRAALPVYTPILKVSWHGLHLARARWINRRDHDDRAAVARPETVSPERYAALCGWSRLGGVAAEAGGVAA